MKYAWILLISFSVTAAELPHKSCGESLYAGLEAVFAQNPQLLYRSARLAPAWNHEFYALNETDFHKAEVDYEPVDVVVGFSTNSAWDIAVRRRAKVLVLADWDSRPLIAQEYILRPVFEFARSRAQFLSLLLGIPVEEPRRGLPLGEFLKAVRVSAAHLVGEHEGFRRDVLESVADDAKLGPVYAAVLHRYYDTRDEMERIESAVLTPPRSLFPGRNGWRCANVLCEFFMRYDPGLAREKPSALIDEPHFSFLASEEAFLHLREMFVSGHVYYAWSDYVDQGLYRTVAQVMKARGLKTIAVSTSNIADSTHHPSTKRLEAAYLSFVRATLSSLREAGLTLPFTFYQTRGIAYPHEFERHVVGSSPASLRHARSE